MPGLGRTLIVLGLALAAIGVVLTLAARFGLPLGRLPGDFVVRREGFTLYLPLATSIVVSIVLSVLFHWFRR